MKALLLLATLLIAQNPRPECGRIGGLVRAADGSPATGVRIAAMAVESDGTVTTSSATLASLSQTDAQGRYLLENVPPGRYFITAGLIDFPSYYPGVKTPQEARAITVASSQRLTSIDFTLAQPSGVRVRGRIANVPPNLPSGIFTAVLQPLVRTTPGMPTPNTPVTVDGFEFSRVPPGTYNVRLLPAGNTPLVRIDVSDKDVDVELTGASFALGRVSIDDGSPLPLVAAAVAAGIPDPPALVQMQATRPGMAGTAAMGAARKDGFFILPLGANAGAEEYVISAAILPLGFYLKSITSGTTDLLRSPFNLTSPFSNDIQVVLTRTPPPGTPAGVTLSGRLTQLENAPAGTPIFVTLQSVATAANSTRFIAEEVPNPDGTFQVRGVPPGRYQMRSVPPSSLPIQTLEVADADIKGLEFPLRTQGQPITGITVVQSITAAVQILTAQPTPTTPALSPGASGLRFTQSGRGPLYIEGAITFFRITNANGTVTEIRLGTNTTAALPAGRYALRSYVRPCDGNCAALDAPTDECATTFTLETGQVLAVERVMDGARCTVRINPSK